MRESEVVALRLGVDEVSVSCLWLMPVVTNDCWACKRRGSKHARLALPLVTLCVRHHDSPLELLCCHGAWCFLSEATGQGPGFAMRPS